MFKIVLRDFCECDVTDEDVFSDITERAIPFLLQDKCTDILSMPARISVIGCAQT